MKEKMSVFALVAILIGAVIIGFGGMKMLDARIGTITGQEHDGCADFTRELERNHSEYLRFDPDPYTTCKDGVLKRNFFDGTKVVLIGGVMILSGILVKVFFVK